MAAFAIDVPSDIYAFHRYTGNSATLSHTPVLSFAMHFLGWAQGFHITLIKPPTHPLRPVNPISARTLCITAAAGTEFAGAYSDGTVKVQGYYPRTLLPNLKSFTTRRPSSLTRHRWIRVAPIVQYSPLLPPVGVWAVSQSQCDWSSSQTSYRSSPW